MSRERKELFEKITHLF